MPVYAVRHGLSEANNYLNYGTPLFGHPDAGLMELGREQSRNTGRLLLTAYGKDPLSTSAATSHMRRTHETALEAGFLEENLTSYPLLDEISNRLSLDQIALALKAQKPPTEAIEQIEELLDNPPEEKVWFTHGFVIATICYVKNIPYPDFIPGHGSIVVLPGGKDGS